MTHILTTLFATHIGSEVFEPESLDQWCDDIGKIMLTEEPYKNRYCTEELLEKRPERNILRCWP